MARLEQWDFWLVCVLPPLLFGVAAFLDSLNKNKVWFWYKNYLPLMLAGLCWLAAKIFPVLEALMPYFLFFFSIWFLLLNWKRFGLNLFALGAALNMLVVISNSNKMPAAPGFDSRSQLHRLIGSETRLPWLTDQISIGNYLVSIGDIFLAIGTLAFLIHQAYLIFKKKWRH